MIARSIQRLPQPTFSEMQQVALDRFGTLHRGRFSHGFKKKRGYPGLLGWLTQLQTVYHCLPPIEQAERTDLGGTPYDYIMRVRLDSRWFAPLPPMAWSLVSSGGASAIFPAEDWNGGLNDRFVLATRSAFSTYARLYLECGAPWQSGSAPNPHSPPRWGQRAPRISWANAEMHLLRAIEHFNHSWMELPLPFCRVMRQYVSYSSASPAASMARAAHARPSSYTCPVCKSATEGLRALPSAPRTPRRLFTFTRHERCCAPPGTASFGDYLMYRLGRREPLDPRICDGA